MLSMGLYPKTNTLNLLPNVFKVYSFLVITFEEKLFFHQFAVLMSKNKASASCAALARKQPQSAKGLRDKVQSVPLPLLKRQWVKYLGRQRAFQQSPTVWATGVWVNEQQKLFFCQGLSVQEDASKIHFPKGISTG